MILSELFIRHKSKIFRYLIVSGFSAVIVLGIPIFMHEVLSIRPEIAVAAALVFAFIINFFLTRVFVFKASGEVLPQILKFIIMSISFRLSEYGLFIILYKYLGIFYIFSLLSTQITAMIIKYFILHHYIFTQGKS